MRNVILLTSNIFENLYGGDSIYTYNIAKLLKRFAEVTIFGFGSDATPSPLSECSDQIQAYPRPPLLQAAWSVCTKRLPIMQARHFSRVMIRDICRYLETHPDTVVVVDHLRMAWLLPALSEKAGKLLLVTHNCETDVARQTLEKETRGYFRWLRRLELACIRAAEKEALQLISAFSAITEEDSKRFSYLFGRSADLILKPGYDGHVLSEIYDPAARPRNILFSGSFFWHLKRRNFVSFLKAAAPTFQQREIGLYVIGSGPPAFLSRIKKHPFVTLFSGNVDLTKVCSQCRLALSLDEIGGGFKLKNLEYIHQGLPIVALQGCEEGLPLRDQQEIFVCQDVDEIKNLIVRLIDDLDRLSAISNAALLACSNRFDWKSRATLLFDLIKMT